MIKTSKTAETKGTGSAKLVLGNLVTLKITAVGPNNVGINEFSLGMPVLVPNAKLGDTVQVKIVKIVSKSNVAVAKLIKVLPNIKTGAQNTGSLTTRTKSKTKTSTTTNVPVDNLSKPALTTGTRLDGTISKLGPNGTGVVELDNSYQNVNKVFVTSLGHTKPGAKINITITRIKTNYAFGVLTNNVNTLNAQDETKSETTSLNKLTQKLKGGINFSSAKFSLVLPKKVVSVSSPKGVNSPSYGLLQKKGKGAMGPLNYMAFKVLNKSTLKSVVTEQNGLKVDSAMNGNILPSNTILLVKPNLGAKAGDKVQIQITKFVAATGNLKSNVAIARIIKLNPMSTKQKKALVKTSLRQMLKSGMHYGEKAIKCNARMKNYVWLRKKGSVSSPKGVANTTLQNLNKPLIKKGRNIINLLKTRRCLNKALAQLAKYAVKGKTFLFVGTKKAASGLVSRASLFSKKAFFVNTRWLGGMLTNWKTILKSISKIRPILKEKQIIIKDILEKRQNIKARLLQKALLLRKKSKVMLKKGRQLIQMLRSTLNSNTNGAGTSDKTYLWGAKASHVLNTKRKELISKGILLLEKRQQLLAKRQELISQSQMLKAKATQLTSTYRHLLNNLMVSRKKLRELKALLIITKELQAFKSQTKQENQNLYMVSYNKFKTLNAPNILSNPPKEILNKMVPIIKGVALVINDQQSALSSTLNLKTTSTNKVKMLSQLLSKFNLFVPTIKTSIKNLQNYTANVQKSLNLVKTLLASVKTKMAAYVDVKNQIVVELRQIKQTLQTERNIIRVLKRKLKQISSQKRLMKFLPKLRYLPTPTHKLEQTARFLMKKFVDPKMKYPMDSIYDEKLSGQSKKVAASRKKKWQRLEKYLGGISNMTKLKEKQIRNNIAIIIGQQEEMNAVRECQKLGIKMFHIVDTNCNPGFADHFIPANDDARNSIKFILGKFLTRIRLAQKLKTKFRKKGVKVRK